MHVNRIPTPHVRGSVFPMGCDEHPQLLSPLLADLLWRRIRWLRDQGHTDAMIALSLGLLQGEESLAEAMAAEDAGRDAPAVATVGELTFWAQRAAAAHARALLLEQYGHQRYEVLINLHAWRVEEEAKRTGVRPVALAWQDYTAAASEDDRRELLAVWLELLEASVLSVAVGEPPSVSGAAG